jgi:mRNA interferase RelE/StbE
MTVQLHPDVLKALRRLPRPTFAAALVKLLALPENPRPAGALKLAGTEHAWRIRIGEYRIIYTIDEKADELTVTFIGPRGDAYRG